MEDIPLSATRNKRPTYKRVVRKRIWGALIVLTFFLFFSGWVSLNSEPVIAPNTYIEAVEVSGLSISKGKQKYRNYWEQQKSKKDLQLKSSYLNKKISSISAEECGLSMDSKALDALDFPTLNLLDKIKLNLNLYPIKRTILPSPIKYVSSHKNKLKNVIKGLVVHSKPAKVLYKKGTIVYQSEGIDYELDEDSSELEQSLINAYLTEKMTVLPIRMAKKRISDESLHSIKDVVSEFSTKFRVYQKDRNYNLHLASKIWNGIIVMPNERVSFNDVVGTRTTKKGFRVATVFNNGKLDKGIGGGICQVSTTLYNALVLANLKIISRSNHSRPVAYIPLGRDAAVVYGGVDLVFENNQKNPIAISSECYGNNITFRVLGSAIPNQKVEITEVILNKESLGMITQEDKSIPLGETKVLDPGALKARVQSYRTIYIEGKKIATQPLHYSFYRGGPRIVLHGTGPTKKSSNKVIASPAETPKMEVSSSDSL